MRLALLLGSTSMAGVCLQPSPAAAQSIAPAGTSNSRTITFAIPPQPLSSAIVAFSRAAGVSVAFDGAVPRDVSTKGVSGAMTPNAALNRLLGGTGLSARFNSASSITLYRPGSAGAVGPVPDGTTLLDTLDVSGAGVRPELQPYQTPGATSYISQETIDRFRGSSPADIFRGTPGVMSGEARNGGGGIDVNIRGMQGMGRVAVTVDGAENSLTVYQGYQGVSNRTFVDPDLLAGVDIIKGSDAASRGIAGTVAMRTVSADDIVEPGKKYGVKIKGGFGTNTASPVAGAVGGYLWPSIPWAGPTVPSSTNMGMNRPGFLEPTSGSGSGIAAWKDENFDLLAGYAYRKQGNYFAGTNGPAAQPVNVGPRRYCFSPGNCPSGNLYQWNPYYDNAGIANYRAGEEVLNTQLETESYLAKGTLRFGDGQSLQVGYNGFRSEAGDLLASRFYDERTQPIQQKQTAGTKLDTGTLRYRWKPEDNNLIDLKANLWLTSLQLRNPRRGSPFPTPESLGLPSDIRTGSDTTMWGGDVTNKSALSFDYGSVDLTYGMSYLTEDTHPARYTPILEGWLNLRDARREEAAAFTKVAYKPIEWLTLNSGLRYQRFWSYDRSIPASSYQINPQPSREQDGVSPSAGVTVEPVRGTQFYVNYSNALRFPSIIEASSAFTLTVSPDLHPERSTNWELGTNVTRDSLFAGGDKGMLKFGYFNWDVKDYIAREYFTDSLGVSGLHIYNIARAKFSGLELSGRYELRGFSAELAANYYLDVTFCRTENTCGNRTLYSDYATNQVPPEYSVNLTLAQKFFDDALTVGGRVSHIGPRAAGHGDVTAQGLSQFINLINWKPYTLVDVFAEYKINETFTAAFRVENLADIYYVDPLGLVQQPAPGRTFYTSLTAKF